MILKTVFIRFYRSFNYDYLRKTNVTAKRMPWEDIDGMWYPHVRVPIEQSITTLVGANESGKTHLLSAVDKGITGEGIERQDFCRYSRFFSVEKGKMRWPGFGFEWTDLRAEDRDAVRQACGFTAATHGEFDHFLFFRENRTELMVYVPEGPETYAPHKVANLEPLKARLPSVFYIDARVGLPDSVPIRYLATPAPKPNKFAALTRRDRHGIFDQLNPEWFKSAETVTKSAPTIFGAIGSFLNPSTNGTGASDEKAFSLARDLLQKVAQIAPEAFAELLRALTDGQEGHANALIQSINDQLASRLNFPKWWAQDKDFSIRISPREFDLVMTIRDRTGTEYLFSERSSGLKYFLSYYVQHRAHEPPADGRREILLMDEPDQFLSSQGQQDLLKIFDAFASPADGRAPVQVMYVTHSPFLIDRNHGERIRVLDKGRSDEGTRVVKDASKNHYEPLRSSLGAFVAETTFMGNCNLMVEGFADQILLAGLANHLRSLEVADSEVLDLNQLTIVPCGSASHVPYMVYLARGRDIEQPAVVVLLDSDQAGNDARKGLEKGGPKNKRLLKSEYILQVGDLPRPDSQGPFRELEDLIPIGICAQAARQYFSEFCRGPDADAQKITPDALAAAMNNGSTSHFKAVESCVEKLGEGYHVDKIAFARTVLDVLPQASAGDRSAIETNLKTLFSELNDRRRKAERELTRESVSSRIDRAKKSFLDDHRKAVSRDRARELLDDMEAVLDDSRDADEVRGALKNLRREFHLTESLAQPVQDFERFRTELDRVQYAGRLATQVS